jgi:2-polyprenyl-3-methyl-5-hydroxy-6-metoxy-1,4-benzoquinol methylase
MLSEKTKYETAWELDDYRKIAPGERFVALFQEIAKPEKGATLIDFGTGTGRAALKLQAAGLSVSMVDIADNCLDKAVKEKLQHQLLITNLWEAIDLPKARYGYCTDVMEHIPPEHVQAVLENIGWLCKFAFFTICFNKDHFGKEVGADLHLTVRPFTWWRDKLRELGTVLEARDLIGEGVFYVEF